MSEQTITHKSLESDLVLFLIQNEADNSVVQQIKETFLNIFNNKTIGLYWKNIPDTDDKNRGKTEIYNYVKYNNLKSTKKILDNFIKNIQKDKYIKNEDKGDIIGNLKKNTTVNNILTKKYDLWFTIFINCEEGKPVSIGQCDGIILLFSFKNGDKISKKKIVIPFTERKFGQITSKTLKQLLQTMVEAECQYKQYILN